MFDDDENPVLDDEGQPVFDEAKPLQRRVPIQVPSWGRNQPPGAAGCPCDCHTVARIGGVLPRLP